VTTLKTAAKETRLGSDTIVHTFSIIESLTPKWSQNIARSIANMFWDHFFRGHILSFQNSNKISCHFETYSFAFPLQNVDLMINTLHHAIQN